MAITKTATIKDDVDELELRGRNRTEVDINDTVLYDGEEHEIDLKEDWQAKAAPPPKGRYRLQLFPQSKQVVSTFDQNIKQGYEDNPAAGTYYTKGLMCKIVSEDEWKGTIVGFNASTGVPRGKTQCNMIGLMLLGGVKIQNPKMSDKAIAAMFAKWLKMEPILVADCDWSAWDTESRTKDNPIGVSLLKGMENFPVVNGKRLHVIKNKKGTEFVAKLKVVLWRGKNTPLAAPPPTVTQAAKQLVSAVAAKVTPAKPAPKVIPQDDLVLDDSPGVGEGLSMDEEGEVILEG